jgi:dihydrolipoamide dehydrogenase
MADKTKITIIGGGVAGYPAAIKAARMGADVTLVEKDFLGGTCLNRGCIPTKSLLHSGEVVQTMKESKTFGINCKGYSVNFKSVFKRKAAVIQQLRNGVEALLKAKQIRVISGTAEFIDAATLLIKETKEEIKSDKILIASGSTPGSVNIKGCDDSRVLNSDQVLELKTMPKSVAIIGGGVIGVEFAQIFHNLGAKVTILELLDGLIPGADSEIAQALEQSMAKTGIDIVTGAAITKVVHKKGKIDVLFTKKEDEKKITAQKIFLCVGRTPDVSSLKIENIGLNQEKGAIVVNNRMETNVPNIYAAGDVIGGIMLAHTATLEGECAVSNALGQESVIDYKTIPSCIYTDPEVASVGMTEEEAMDTHEIEVGRFPFYACGKALVIDRTDGMVKIISEKKFGEVLGVHIIGPRATDMISEAVLGMTMEMTIEELAHAVHPHPTLSEAMMEGALSLCGGAVHLP